MIKAEEANGRPLLNGTKSWAEAGQKHLSPAAKEEGSHTTSSAEGVKPSVWEAASPPQQEQTWKENYATAKKKHEEEQNNNESTDGAIVNNSRSTSSPHDLVVPQFVVIMAWRRICDDDAVSDLNSEADVEDEDCLPEATIQVLEALFGEFPLDGDDDEEEEDLDEDEDDDDKEQRLDGYKGDNEDSSSGGATAESSSLSEAAASLDLTAAISTTTAEKENRRENSKETTDAVKLPVVTMQVLKSIFTSMDDLDNASTTTDSTTSLETTS